MYFGVDILYNVFLVSTVAFDLHRFDFFSAATLPEIESKATCTYIIEINVCTYICYAPS
jgi:hypothetical protein